MADGDESTSQQDTGELGRMRARLEDYRTFDDSSLDDGKKKRLNRMKRNLAKEIEVKEKKKNVDNGWEISFPPADTIFYKTPAQKKSGPTAEGAVHRSESVDDGSQRDTVDAGNRSDTVDDGSPRDIVDAENRSGTDDAGNQGVYHDLRGQSDNGGIRHRPTEEQIHFICKVVKDTPDRDLVIRRARVLILVNADFDTLNHRDEAKEDYKQLNKVLIEGLGYENFFVHALTKLDLDKTKAFGGITAELVNEYPWNREKMLTVIKKLANTEYDGDALMLFVNSHGSNIQGRDAVAGTDYISPDKTGDGKAEGAVMVDEIIEILNDKNCHASVRKIPKFVFVQACRGEKKIPTSDIIVKDGNAQSQSTEGVVYDILHSLEKMSLEEETVVTPDSGVPASADTSDTQHIPDQGVEGSDSESARDLLGGETGEAVAGPGVQQPSVSEEPNTRTTELQARALRPLDAKEDYEAQGARPKVPSRRSNLMPTPDIGIPHSESKQAAGDASMPTPVVSPAVKNISLPNIPENFLIVYSVPKGCLSGRIPTTKLDRLIVQGGCIFTQIFALHLEKCLSEPSFTVDPGDRGIALLPLLTGVQNEISLSWLEIGVLEHRLRKLPVLGKT